MRIRRAKPEEGALLSALAMESKAHWGYAAQTLDKWRVDLTIGSSQIVTFPTYVAELGEELAGFYMLQQGDPSFTLEHLWVRPSCMHQGVGAQLLRHALMLAAYAGASRVRANADPHAAGFYERQGGKRTGATAAPLPNEPDRVLPIYEFSLEVPDKSLERTRER